MNRPRSEAACLTRRGALLGVLCSVVGTASPAQAGLALTLPHAAGFGQPMESLADRLLTAGGLAAPNGNHVLSPWSLYAALGLLALGAGGQTSRGFARLLGVVGTDPAQLARALRRTRLALAHADTVDARLQRAESAWVGMPWAFRPRWRGLARLALDTRGQRLDFAAADAVEAVNGWASRATQGSIPVLLDRFPAGADFILGSAVHFAGQWAMPFDQADSAPAPFRNAAGGSTEVPMMYSERPALYGQKGPGHAVVLPYASRRIVMVLATAQQPEATPAFLDLLRRQGTIGYLRSVPFAATGPLEVRLPRFGFDSGGDVLPSLNAMGLGPLLGRGADLSGITGRPALVDAIMQRARVAVDERGTVAAAATAVIASRSMQLDRPAFSADRPFVFLIATGTVGTNVPFLPLFLGYVGDAAHAQA